MRHVRQMTWINETRRWPREQRERGRGMMMLVISCKVGEDGADGVVEEADTGETVPADEAHATNKTGDAMAFQAH